MAEKPAEDSDLYRCLRAPDVPNVEIYLMVGGEQRVGFPGGERGAVGEEPVVGRVVRGNILQQRQNIRKFDRSNIC